MPPRQASQGRTAKLAHAFGLDLGRSIGYELLMLDGLSNKAYLPVMGR